MRFHCAPSMPTPIIPIIPIYLPNNDYLYATAVLTTIQLYQGKPLNISIFPIFNIYKRYFHWGKFDKSYTIQPNNYLNLCLFMNICMQQHVLITIQLHCKSE